jgi:hypothetical protein
VRQRREECPVAWVEAHFLLAQLALQHGDLMAEGKDFNVLVPIARRQ